MPHTQNATKLLPITMLNTYGYRQNCTHIAVLNSFSILQAEKRCINMKGLNTRRNAFTIK